MANAFPLNEPQTRAASGAACAETVRCGGSENRLVADELERRWNQALERAEEIEQRIEQHVHGLGKSTTPTQEEFEELAAKLETVWNCADTSRGGCG